MFCFWDIGLLQKLPQRPFHLFMGCNYYLSHVYFGPNYTEKCNISLCSEYLLTETCMKNPSPDEVSEVRASCKSVSGSSVFSAR